MTDYMVSATDIVGYTFNADNHCEDCTRDIAKANAAAMGSATCWGDCGSAEQILAEWASLIGLDRHDEQSFDSGEFPKVIFASQVEGDERCGTCHGLLIW